MAEPQTISVDLTHLVEAALHLPDPARDARSNAVDVATNPVFGTP